MSFESHAFSIAFGIALLMIGVAMIFSKGFFERSARHMVTAGVFAVVGVGITLSGTVMYLIERITLS